MDTELGRAQEGALVLHQTLEQVKPHVSLMLNICVSHGVTHVSLEQLSQMIEQLQQSAEAAKETAVAAAEAAASAAGERDRLQQEKKDLVQAAEEAHTAERLALEQAATAAAAVAVAEKRLGESEERRVAFEEDVRRQEAVGERE